MKHNAPSWFEVALTFALLLCVLALATGMCVASAWGH